MKWQEILFIILAILAMIIGLLYLFGNSPTLEQTISSFMFVTLIGAIIKLSTIDFRLKFIEKRFDRLEQSFIKLASDFRELKYDLNSHFKIKKSMHHHGLKAVV